MQSKAILNLNAISKAYKIYSSPMSQLASLLTGGLLGRYNNYQVLENVNISVNKGETLGIIGRNGAGKSTLLQIITGIVAPTSGSISMFGKIAALLELGAGFNVEYSGRENIFLVSAIYGLTKKETSQLLNKIIDFAEIGPYIDRPVKTYSSGMFVRLAFAIVAHLNVEILIVDEALAVGDISFQQKCNRFFVDFKARGGTVIFVSHDITLVKTICDKVLYLKRGDSFLETFHGDAEKLCDQYLSDFYIDEHRRRDKNLVDAPILTDILREHKKLVQPPIAMVFSDYQSNCLKKGLGGVVVNDIVLRNSLGDATSVFSQNEKINLFVQLEASRTILDLAIAIIVKDRTGQFLISEGTSELSDNGSVAVESGHFVSFNFNFRMPYLIEGSYSIDFSITDGSKLDHSQIYLLHDALVLNVSRGRNVVGLVGLEDYDFNIDVY